MLGFITINKKNFNAKISFGGRCGMQEKEQERIVEPLAKYPTKVMIQGRITLISTIRKYYNIELGDFIELIIRKKTKDEIIRGHFIARVYDKGYLTIPKGLREKMNIKNGDFVELLIIDIFKSSELFGEKAKLMAPVLKIGYELIDEAKEKQLMMLRVKQV